MKLDMADTVVFLTMTWQRIVFTGMSWLSGCQVYFSTLHRKEMVVWLYDLYYFNKYSIYIYCDNYDSYDILCIINKLQCHGSGILL